MADPISIIGLIQTVSDILIKLYRYGKDVKNATEQIAALCKELSMLQHVLEHIEQRRKEADALDEQFNDFLSSAGFQQITTEAMAFVSKLADELGATRNTFQKTIHTLKWPFTSKDIQERLDWLKSANSWYTLAILSDTSTNLDHVLVDLHSIRDDLADDRIERRQYNDARERSELSEQVFKAFTTVDFDLIHRQICSKWLPDTGTWFLNGAFRAWYQNMASEHQIMWVQGRSGAGKSTIFAQAVDRAKTHAQTQKGFNVAYFYCTSALDKSQEPKAVVSSWITQLADVIYGFPHRFSSNIRKSKKVPIEDLLAAITETADLKPSEHFLLFVDAVNESKEAKAILDTLGQILKGHSNIRVLLTCTPELEPTPLKASIAVREVHIGRADSKQDIERYVTWRMANSPVLSTISVELHQEVFDVLMKENHGMFRWTQCQLDFLDTQRSGRAIRQKLHQLPDDLNKTYVAVLGRTTLSHDDVRIVQEAFVWLCYSRRPLSLVELCEAISIEYDMTTMDPDDRIQDGKAIIRLCGGLVVLSEQTGLVTFAHDSVRAFLTSNYIRSTAASKFAVEASSANARIIRKCITYLCFEDFRQGFIYDDDKLREVLDNFPFLPYASAYWMRHHRRYPPQDTVTQEAIKRLFLSYTLPGSGNFGFWVRCVSPRLDSKKKALVAQSQPLYYAASFGLIELVSWLLESGLVKKHAEGDVMDIDAKGGKQHSTALAVACFRSHQEVVALLLEHGANPEPQNIHGTTPLRDVDYQGILGDVTQDDTKIYEMLTRSIESKRERENRSKAGRREEQSLSAGQGRVDEKGEAIVAIRDKH